MTDSKTARFKLVTSDGTITYKDKMTLKDMQKFVGGYIEYYGNAIMNEEGRLENLPSNKLYPLFVGNLIIDQKMRVRKDMRVV